MKTLHLAGCWLALGLMPMALAEKSPYCGQHTQTAFSKQLAGLAGSWTLGNQGGYARSDRSDMLVTLKGSSKYDKTVALNLAGGNLTFKGEFAAPVSVPLKMETKRAWLVSTGGGEPKPRLDIKEMAVLYGCPETQLPRLTGTGNFSGQDGSGSISLFLYVLEKDFMYGFLTTAGKTPAGKSVSTSFAITLRR